MQGIGLRHIARLWQAGWPRERSTWQLEGFIAIVKALAHGNLLLGELRAGVGPVVVSASAVDFGLGQQILCEARDLFSIWVLAEWTSESTILVLATQFVRLEQVVEASFISFAICTYHGFVQALLVELRLVQTVFEVLTAHGLNMGRTQGATFFVVMDLKTVIADMGKCSVHHPPLLLHLVFVLVHPSIPLRWEIHIFGGARIRLAQVVW